MGTAIVWFLGIATALGGIAAVGYFLDKWREKQEWTEKEKVVNSNWWESSDLKKNMRRKGVKSLVGQIRIE